MVKYAKGSHNYLVMELIKSDILSLLDAFQKQHMIGIVPLFEICALFNTKMRIFPKPQPRVVDILTELQHEGKAGLIMSNRSKRFVVCPLAWKESLSNDDMQGFNWQHLINARERWLNPSPELPQDNPAQYFSAGAHESVDERMAREAAAVDPEVVRRRMAGEIVED